jgi:hypothetical protein
MRTDETPSGQPLSVGLTLAELERSARVPAARLAPILADELARGRISRSGERYSLVPDAFPPELLAALRQLVETETPAP